MDDETEVKIKKPKLTAVRVIQTDRKAGTVLVEYAGGQKRALLPLEAAQGGQVEKSALEAAFPYGVPWEELQVRTPDPAELARELRAAGIWTCDDLAKHAAQVFGIIARLQGANRAALVEFARQYKDN